ncbi:putative transposase like protein [Trichonephila clavipes]|nr:putative transposase like protein [Trichonephila clavipes]
MGKKGDFSLCKKAELNSLVNAKLFSNREISRKLKVSEASVRRIKKKIESGEELSPNRKKNAAESLFPPQARSIKAFLAEQNIPLLDWPGNSPDMNPIENIWELMKREVAKDVITNKTQLLERIIHVCNHHPQMQETVQSCIDSMPRRIEALIAAKGGSTKY